MPATVIEYEPVSRRWRQLACSSTPCEVVNIGENVRS